MRGTRMRRFGMVWGLVAACTSSSKDPVDDTDVGTDDTDPVVDDTDPADDTDTPADDTDLPDVGDPIAEGELVITELMITTADCPDGAGEYVEFVNVSARTLDIEGLELNVSGQRFRLATPTSIAPGQWVLATKEPPAGTARCWGLTGTFSYPVTLILGNGGGAVGLRKGSVLIDTVDYQVGAVSVGRSIQLDPNRLTARANDLPGNWCLSDPLIAGATADKGTPADTNHECGSVEPPLDTGPDTDTDTLDTDTHPDSGGGDDTDTETGGGGDDTDTETGGGGGGDDTSGGGGDDTSGGGGDDTAGGGDDTAGGGDDTVDVPDTAGGGDDTSGGGDDTATVVDTAVDSADSGGIPIEPDDSGDSSGGDDSGGGVVEDTVDAPPSP